MNEMLKLISQRRSCRSFKQEKIKDNELQAILQAGIQAPSAVNRQLCEVFAITNTAIVDELAAKISYVLNERGDIKSPEYHCAYHAPILVIVSGPEYDSRRVEDGSCMLENIFLAATSLNIGSCWINQLKDTQNVDEVREFLSQIGIPANHQVIGCAALGYIDKETPVKGKNIERIHIIE